MNLKMRLSSGWIGAIWRRPRGGIGQFPRPGRETT